MQSEVQAPPLSRGAMALCHAAACAAILAFAARALDTARIYNHTIDEPTQIASGLELLQYGTFELHVDVPPLAKVLLAAPLYASGVRLAAPPRRGSIEDGNALLYERGDYWRGLRSARAVSTVIGAGLLASLYAAAMAAFGPIAAVATILVASVSPGLVSAASIANSDILGVLTLLIALYAFRRWLRHPGPGAAAAFATAAALAILAKLSALPFLAFGLPAIAAFQLGVGALAPLRHPLRFLRAHGLELAVVAFGVPLLIWACYGFASAPVVGKLQAAELASAHPRLAGIITRLATLPIPLGGFLRGLGVASTIAQRGHPAFLFGAISLHGWPWYFLATLGLKVPIAILALVSVAFALALVRRRDPEAREVLLLLSVCAAILLSVARAGVNAGHRHVIAVEALFALVIGGGVALALREADALGKLLRPAMALGVAAAAFVSFRAHPDALGYFNAFAGAMPDRYLADSNIDWGQDLERLARWERDAHLEEPLHLAYFGSAVPARHGVRALPLQPGDRPSGWVAASIQYERGLAGSGIGQLPDEPHRTGYAWLLSLQPAAQIGTSIRVYHVTAAELATLAERGMSR